MKNSTLLFSLVALLAPVLVGNAQNSPAGANANAANVRYAVASREANSRHWVKITSRTNAAGEVSYVTNKAYVELASGLNRFSTQNNAWVDSDPTIEVAGNTGSAAKAAHTVTFAQDAATADGAILLTTPDGKNFVSRVYGLSYWDPTTGSNLLLGSIQSSQGYVVGTNELVYSNAFSGSVTADLEYFNKIAGLEQNVVLRTALPAPDTFVGLNDATTRLQIWTEFLSAPQPQEIEATTDGVREDSILDFGAMKIGVGKAFATPQDQSLIPGAGMSHVLKHWLQRDGRTFLIEEVPYEAISNAVHNLPPQASITTPSGDHIKRTASMLPLQAIPTEVKLTSGPMRLAKSAPDRPGVVIDYSMVGGYETNYVFQGDTTYYVSAAVLLYGTTVFESDAVIKYYNASSYIGLGIADPSGSFQFNGISYGPSVFTDANDNTIGETISGSSGSPSIGSVIYLYWDAATNAAVTASHIRISYALVALAYKDSGSVTIRDSQILHSEYGLFLTGGLFGSVTNQVDLENVLESRVWYGINGVDVGVVGEHVTADTISTGFVYVYGGVYNGNITNSIFTDVYSGTNLNFYDSVVAASGSGIYQTVGAASYYLTNGSPYRNAGTTNINAKTLAELKNMTTWAPTDIASNLAANLILSPVVPRDNSGTNVDIGYHYDPIDAAIFLYDAGYTITVLPGTALATYAGDNYYGIWINSGGSLNSQGTPTNPNHIVRYNTVQEQSTTNWPVYSYGNSSGAAPSVLFDPLSNPDASSLYCRFTTWSEPAGAFHLYAEDTLLTGSVGLQDCQLFGGSFTYIAPNAYFTNNLFDGVDVMVGNYFDNLNFVFNNTTMSAGTFTFEEWGTSSWSFQNNLFDQTFITNGESSVGLYSNNAYVNTNFGTLTGPTNTGDQVLGSSPLYEIGALGQFYQPTNSSLIFAGSMTAGAAGLYHYTVTTNNVVDGTNMVSIGFHYVAVDANGNPLDTNGDGIPDYLEDANGDGLVDDGEQNWIINPWNGLTYSSGLEVFTPLK